MSASYSVGALSHTNPSLPREDDGAAWASPDNQYDRPSCSQRHQLHAGYAQPESSSRLSIHHTSAGHFHLPSLPGLCPMPSETRDRLAFPSLPEAERLAHWPSTSSSTSLSQLSIPHRQCGLEPAPGPGLHFCLPMFPGIILLSHHPRKVPSETSNPQRESCSRVTLGN